MGRHLQVSAICSMLSLLLLFSMRLAVGFAEQKDCSSSCGMKKIDYPFRLEDDPAGCGDSRYQLICDRNITVLYMESNKYYVTEISYKDGTINVVDSRLASGSCVLPFPSPSPIDLLTWTPYVQYNSLIYNSPIYWATFANCTGQIKNDMYRPIPCLSKHDAFVYAVLGEESYELQYVEPSCRFLATAPMASTPEMDSMTDVFKLLQKGFVLTWKMNKFQLCLRQIRSSLQDIKSYGYPLPSKILYGYLSCFNFLPCIVVRYTLSYRYYIGDVLYMLTIVVELLISMFEPRVANHFFLKLMRYNLKTSDLQLPQY